MRSTLAPSDPVIFKAKYYDGRQAIAHRVFVQLSTSALVIKVESGEVLETWAYPEVELGDRAKDWVRIAKRGSDARLSLEDPHAYEVLQAMTPNLMSRQKRLRRGMLMAMASTAAVIALVYYSIPLIANAVVAVIPPSLESRMGHSTAVAIETALAQSQKRSVCADVQGRRALDRLVNTLAQHTDGSFPYQVKVLDVDMTNAIALPGGYIFIFKGLLDEAESAEEVAGVLAHEMAHVDLRHSLHGLIRQTGLSVLADMVFGGSSFGGLSSFMLGATYTREAEEAADDQAVRTLRKAGISSHGFAAFFERLQIQEAKARFGLPDFLSTHPPNALRAQLARKAGRAGIPVLNDIDWERLKKICE